MTLAEYIVALRVRLKDSADSNFIRQENLTSQVSPNLVQPTPVAITFFLDDFRKELGGLIVGIPTVTAAAVSKTVTVISVTQGSFSIIGVPATPLLASYFWNYFSDVEYTSYINGALSILAGYLIVDLVPTGLHECLINYALSMAYKALSQRAVMLFEESNDPVTIKPDSLAKKWLELSKDAFANAQKLHEQYNRGSFQQLRPYGMVHQAPLGNLMWTPYR